jgi:hypothetical protein
MPVNIRTILTSAEPHNLGLLPYLSKRLGGDWDRFQIHPWNFASVEAGPNGRAGDNNSGWRLGLQSSSRSPDGRTQTIIQELRVGYVLSHTDPLELQILAAELADRINQVVANWSCCTQHAKECVNDSTGGFVYSQHGGINSGAPNAWAIAIVREFELVLEVEVIEEND